MAHLTNRMITLLIIAGFCVVMPLAMAIKVLGGSREPTVDRSLTTDSIDAAIAKRLLAQPATPTADIAPPAYCELPRASFGQRRFSR